MDDLPEFDAESLFGNWPRDDNAESTTYVDDTSSGNGLVASSKANLTSLHLNQILDAAEPPDGGDDTCKDDSGEPAADLGSSSTQINNNFTFPMYYPLNQGRNHPLAMTSMASCPPYANATPTAAPSPLSSGQSNALESSGLQSLMSQQPQPQQVQQQLALATSFNAVNSNNNNNNASSGDSSSNNMTSSTLSYNSPYSTHLRELTANFRNNSNVSVHYGMAVNGFHPQVNARVNPVFPLSNNGGIGGATTNAATQQTTLAGGAGNTTSGTKNSRKQARGKPNAAAAAPGATSTHTRNSRERNNREQVRAQKITQLISELRENMEKGGWQEEMKSKYQTLSQ